MNDDTELRRLWDAHAARRLPRKLADHEAGQELWEDLAGYDSRIAAAVITLMEGREVVGADPFAPEAGLRERARTIAGENKARLAAFAEYVDGLDALGVVAGRIWKRRQMTK